MSNEQSFYAQAGLILAALTFLWQRLEKKFDQVEKKFDKIDARFEKLESILEKRFDRIESKIDILFTNDSKTESRVAFLEGRAITIVRDN